MLPPLLYIGFDAAIKSLKDKYPLYYDGTYSNQYFNNNDDNVYSYSHNINRSKPNSRRGVNIYTANASTNMNQDLNNTAPLTHFPFQNASDIIYQQHPVYQDSHFIQQQQSHYNDNNLFAYSNNYNYPDDDVNANNHNTSDQSNTMFVPYSNNGNGSYQPNGEGFNNYNNKNRNDVVMGNSNNNEGSGVARRRKDKENKLLDINDFSMIYRDTAPDEEYNEDNTKDTNHNKQNAKQLPHNNNNGDSIKTTNTKNTSPHSKLTTNIINSLITKEQKSQNKYIIPFYLLSQKDLYKNITTFYHPKKK